MRIPAQDKTPRVDPKIRIRQDVVEQLEAYAAFTGYDRDYIMEQAIVLVLKADPEFRRSSKRGVQEADQTEAGSKSKQKRGRRPASQREEAAA